jgi:hypothetical protein
MTRGTRVSVSRPWRAIAGRRRNRGGGCSDLRDESRARPTHTRAPSGRYPVGVIGVTDAVVIAEGVRRGRGGLRERRSGWSRNGDGRERGRASLSIASSTSAPRPPPPSSLPHSFTSESDTHAHAKHNKQTKLLVSLSRSPIGKLFSLRYRKRLCFFPSLLIFALPPPPPPRARPSPSRASRARAPPPRVPALAARGQYRIGKGRAARGEEAGEAAAACRRTRVCCLASVADVSSPLAADAPLTLRSPCLLSRNPPKKTKTESPADDSKNVVRPRPLRGHPARLQQGRRREAARHGQDRAHARAHGRGEALAGDALGGLCARSGRSYRAASCPDGCCWPESHLPVWMAGGGRRQHG